MKSIKKLIMLTIACSMLITPVVATEQVVSAEILSKRAQKEFDMGNMADTVSNKLGDYADDLDYRMHQGKKVTAKQKRKTDKLIKAYYKIVVKTYPKMNKLGTNAYGLVNSAIDSIKLYKKICTWSKASKYLKTLKKYQKEINKARKAEIANNSPKVKLFAGLDYQSSLTKHQQKIVEKKNLYLREDDLKKLADFEHIKIPADVKVADILVYTNVDMMGPNYVQLEYKLSNDQTITKDTNGEMDFNWT